MAQNREKTFGELKEGDILVGTSCSECPFFKTYTVVSVETVGGEIDIKGRPARSWKVITIRPLSKACATGHALKFTETPYPEDADTIRLDMWAYSENDSRRLLMSRERIWADPEAACQDMLETLESNITRNRARIAALSRTMSYQEKMKCYLNNSNVYGEQYR